MTNARLEELRAKFQENPRRYFAPFANELRKAGDPAQAISVCRAQLAGQPGHVSGHIVLGQALYEAGEADEARDVFTTAIELDPENLIALRSLGEIAQVNGEFNTARQWYERLLEADPRNNDVTQLLRDMPAEASPAPAIAPLVDLADEPTPFTVRQEIEETPAEPEAPRSTFHTSFTGSGRAYESKEPEQAVEPAESPSAPIAESSPEATKEPFIDLEPSAHDSSPAQAEPMVTAAAEAESLDMVDFDSLPQATADEFSTASAPPDESFESFETQPSAETHDMEIEPSAAASQPSGAEEFGEAELIETNFAATTEPASSEESVEPPRAMFAERGFDGPVEDDLGWMTTPSAALSDPEAAPEDWFDESVSPEGADAAPEPRAEEVIPTEMSHQDQATDSWFDEVEGAAAIESTEVTTDELWLPPELPSFAAADETTARSAQTVEEPVGAVEASSAPESTFDESAPDEVQAAEAPNDIVHSEWSAPDDAAVTSAQSGDQPEPSWMESATPDASIVAPDEGAAEFSAAAQQDVDLVAEKTGFDVHAMADAADEAFVVERPVEASSAPSHDEAPPQSWEAERPVEAMSREADVEVIHAGVESSPQATNAGAGVGHSSETVEAESSVPAAPFITETLAELYLQQGFRDEALSIFRQLMVREPQNQALKDRVAAMEKGELPTSSQSSDVPVEERASSQSVRTFFSRLARRPAVTPSPENPATNAASTTPDVPFAAAASALASLFSASKPPTSDEGAASTLAGAFDPSGRPSRATDRELSLDHLFRDVAPGGSPTGGVTLDEFYSTPNAAQGSPTEPGEATESDEPGGTDIRQFTAWLEGLRKK